MDVAFTMEPTVSRSWISSILNKRFSVCCAQYQMDTCGQKLKQITHLVLCRCFAKGHELFCWFLPFSCYEMSLLL